MDASLYKVQESRDRKGKNHQEAPDEEESQKKEKDQFDKEKRFWKRLVPEGTQKSSGLVSSPLQVRKDSLLSSGTDFTEDEGAGEVVTSSVTEDMSLSLSLRMLVMWGVLDVRGKPRLQGIVIYGVVISVIVLSAVLLLRLLWR